MSYRQLSTDKTIKTINRLYNRIEDRFPESSLLKVCMELLQIANASAGNIERIKKPNYLLRGAVGLFLMFCLGAMIYSASLLDIKFHGLEVQDVVALLEASINDLLLMGAAVFFLFRIEGQIKRKKALRSLHELRTIAHVIDMHQLTKDPSRNPDSNTMHSPKQQLPAFQMGRYLDYCSEMLSLTGKVAALYANGTDDSVVLNTINEVEALTNGLSSKVWQKIMILKGVEPK
ncbi:MAG: hypothetical protein AAF570_00420 [Bacteroidota bacterium]